MSESYFSNTRRRDIPPPSIPGFEEISRYWDQERGMVAAKLLPGEYYVTREDELITTVLGSCISACICDKVAGIGGMNHFMLPETSEERLQSGDEAVVGIATRYGNYAMEHLINTILKYGGQRKNLEVKLFGGGKIIPAMTNIGLKNIGFVLDYIDTEQLHLVSQDLGDVYPRKIIYFPKTGKAMMKKLKELRNDTIVQREIEYRKHIKEKPVEGEIELFGLWMDIMEKIRVLIIDDSALIRKLLSEIFQATPDIEVVGVAADPYIARDKIKQLNPDVLTLDIEMPRMDGLTFLRNLMRLRPMPVVMVSTLTEYGAEATLQALALGAVDFVAKPKVDVAQNLADYAEEIVEKVRMAARARVSVLETPLPAVKSPATEPAHDVKLSADAVLRAQPVKPPPKTLGKLIAIGASTGGTEAIKEVVRQLPADSPPVVISQHLPAPFSESFARHVDMVSPMRAQLAAHQQELLPGHIYIAPGDYHLIVVREGTRYIGHLNDGPPVNRHRPSVDVMFRSVAQSAAQQAIAVLLTGMGNDGAQGMKEIHDTGARTLIQDEKTSVVWGMPGEAYRLGAADYMLPLGKIAAQIIALTKV